VQLNLKRVGLEVLDEVVGVHQACHVHLFVLETNLRQKRREKDRDRDAASILVHRSNCVPTLDKRLKT
jgi:hypothetical protein